MRALTMASAWWGPRAVSSCHRRPLRGVFGQCAFVVGLRSSRRTGCDDRAVSLFLESFPRVACVKLTRRVPSRAWFVRFSFVVARVDLVRGCGAL